MHNLSRTFHEDSSCHASEHRTLPTVGPTCSFDSEHPSLWHRLPYSAAHRPRPHIPLASPTHCPHSCLDSSTHSMALIAHALVCVLQQSLLRLSANRTTVASRSRKAAGASPCVGCFTHQSSSRSMTMSTFDCRHSSLERLTLNCNVVAHLSGEVSSKRRFASTSSRMSRSSHSVYFTLCSSSPFSCSTFRSCRGFRVPYFLRLYIVSILSLAMTRFVCTTRRTSPILCPSYSIRVSIALAHVARCIVVRS